MGPGGEYLFGRVIDGPLPSERAPMPGAYLVYVYRHRSETSEPDMARLRPTELLIPPRFVNQLGWTKGYFLPIGGGPVHEADRLARHCFRDPLKGTHRDVSGSAVEHVAGFCGEWSLGDHRTLDDQVSEALGIPRASTD